MREKDLSPSAYRELALRAIEAVDGRCPLILHRFYEEAIALGMTAIHLPLPILRQLCEEEKARFTVIGASTHSLEEAREAASLGCTYVTAGHVFETACKEGLPGRGLDFLREVCAGLSIPVYAIGGISPSNIGLVRAAGAAGACVMSGAMECENVREYLTSLAGISV